MKSKKWEREWTQENKTKNVKNKPAISMWHSVSVLCVARARAQNTRTRGAYVRTMVVLNLYKQIESQKKNKINFRETELRAMRTEK